MALGVRPCAPAGSRRPLPRRSSTPPRSIASGSDGSATHARAAASVCGKVVVDDDAVGVVDVLIDAVLDLAVAAPDGLVLVEDRLPGGEVGPSDERRA